MDDVIFNKMDYLIEVKCIIALKVTSQPGISCALSVQTICRRKVNVLEMKCWRSLVGVSRMDRVRNEEVRRRAGIEMELASRPDQRALRWFGHVERMDDYRMARRVLMAEVSGGRVRGRPRLGWMDGVRVALGNRGITVEAARQCAKDRKEWRSQVHM